MECLCGQVVRNTHSVTPQSWKTSGTTLTRHSLQSRGTLCSRSTRGSSISLSKMWEGEEKKGKRRRKEFSGKRKFKTSGRKCCLISPCGRLLFQVRIYLSTIVSSRSGRTTGTSGSNGARCTTLTGETSVALKGRVGGQLDKLMCKSARFKVILRVYMTGDH